MLPIIAQLLHSPEPSIRYKVRVNVLGEEPDSPGVQALREEIRTSARVTALLSERSTEGTLPHGPYRKWRGAHWVLATLAELGYPAGDAALAPMVAQVCDCWLSPRHVASVPMIQGRPRCHASQEGNALFALLTLGFVDERADRLAEHLLHRQWPDGGWNCDKQPDAHVSSFHESWIPLRALSLYGTVRQHATARDAAARTAELFLSRSLFRRLSNHTIIKPSFLLLMYPPYWHYGILNGLTVMAEAGFIRDPRCTEALDRLESKRLPDGGFPAEVKHYTTAPSAKTGNSLVQWGNHSAGQMNEWVTAEALAVLKAAGRIGV